MGKCVSLFREGELGIVRIDNPPVNALSPETMSDLASAFEMFEGDSSLTGAVIECAGRTFVAGGDIRAFDAPDFSPAQFNTLLARIEASARPVAAALFGAVYGGGLELAMACHLRVAHPTTKLALPEIKLGILPGSLGTQRLPRLVGLRTAYEMISTGEAVSARFGLEAGMVDALAENYACSAREMIRAAAATGVRPRRTSVLQIPDLHVLDEVLALAEAAAKARPKLLALGQIGPCLEAGARDSFHAGERVEANAFEMLRTSAQSRAQRHIFFAERAAARLPAASSAPQPDEIVRVAMIDAVGEWGLLADRARNAGLELVELPAWEPRLMPRVDVVFAGSAVRVPADLGKWPDLLQGEPIVLSPTVDHRSTPSRWLRANPADRTVEFESIVSRSSVVASVTALSKRLGMAPVLSAGNVGSRMKAALNNSRAELIQSGVPQGWVDRVLASSDWFGLGVGRTELGSADTARPSSLTEYEIYTTVLADLANEAADLLEKGAAFRASDIDFLMVRGYGFPVWYGGPVFMSDEVGLSILVARLDRQKKPVASLLREMAIGEKRMSNWQASTPAAQT